jgi:guanylate kinase
MENKKGRLFVISGPSGAGKSTLINSVLEEFEDFTRSVSVTTRPKRNDSSDKERYRFLTDKQFEEMISNDDLLEYAEFCDYYYGTPKKFVKEMLSRGINVILEIEVQGAIQIKKKIKDAYMIFILTPDRESLKKRLKNRNTENCEQIKKRMLIANEELKYQKHYDCIIVNNDYNEALLNLKYILNKEKES